MIDKYGLGTAFGNMIEKRYLKNTKFVKNADLGGRASRNSSR